jgi:hypothetical protein
MEWSRDHPWKKFTGIGVEHHHYEEEYGVNYREQ